jgi:hypothetical protein
MPGGANLVHDGAAFGSSGDPVFRWNEKALWGRHPDNGVQIATAAVQSGGSSAAHSRILILRPGFKGFGEPAFIEGSETGYKNGSAPAGALPISAE